MGLLLYHSVDQVVGNRCLITDKRRAVSFEIKSDKTSSLSIIIKNIQQFVQMMSKV